MNFKIRDAKHNTLQFTPAFSWVIWKKKMNFFFNYFVNFLTKTF